MAVGVTSAHSLRYLRRHWTAALVGVLALLLVVGAGFAQGFPVADVKLNDGSVWVTNRTLALAGKLNKQIDDLETSTQLFNSDFELWQDDELLVSRDNVTSQLTQLDPATSTPSAPLLTPVGSEISVAAGKVSLVDPTSGRMWARDASGFWGLDFVKSKADFDLGPSGQAVLSHDGNAVAVSPSRGEIVHLGAQQPDVAELPQPLGLPLNFELSAVGERAVVLDRSAQTVWIEGGAEPIPLPNAASARLQAPSAAGLQVDGQVIDAVIATGGGLLGLTGDELRPLAPGAAGSPIQPVVVNGCAYGAFTSGASAQVSIECTGREPRVLDVPQYSGGSLAYRVNRGLVVLNDERNGDIWLVDDDMRLVDGWQKVAPPKPEEGKETPDDDVVELVNPDRSGPNRPPVAVDDTFGVRAGRDTMIPVVKNDTDPDGDILTVEGPPRLNGAALSLVRGGNGLQVTVPEDAEGKRLNFRYTVSDGRGGSDSANVSLDVRSRDQRLENNPPVLADKPEPLVVPLGGEGERRVLLDWRDPDGDDLVLLDAEPPGDDEVSVSPDGVLSYTDVGTKAGRKEIRVTVSDGVAEAEGVLVVEARKSGDIKPKANGDYYAGRVDTELTLKPLENDEGEQIALSQVGVKVEGARVKPNYDDGTISFTADKPGSYYVGYVISNRATSFGVIRVDVRPAKRENAAPVATRDLALLPAGGQVLVDPLANDEDADGDVLAIQTVATDPNLRIKMIQRQLLEITAVTTPEAPITLSYTVSDGENAVPGTIVVVPTKPPATLSPVAVNDSVTIRAGDTASVRVLANDKSPAGYALKLDAELPEEPAAGQAWTDGEEFRFSAPAQAGEYRAVYQLRDSTGEVASAQVRIFVVAAQVENTPPEPKAVTGRVLAGTKARIAIGLEGIDPQGDAVRLLGLDSGPELGRITLVGERWLEYEAYEGSAGTDTFTYAVTDAKGARAVGEARVGVIPKSATNTPPLATEDEVTARPGRVVRVPVLANDSDPDGDRFGFAENPLTFPDEARVVDDTIEFTVPKEQGTYVGQYRIIDSRGLESTGDVVITIDPDAPLLAPVARDDIVSAADVATSPIIDVPVVRNDYDPDGSIEDLKVSVREEDVEASERAAAVDDNVRVKVAKFMRQVRYRITDADKQSGWAIVTVPGNADSVPALREDIVPQSVVAGRNLDLDINEFVIGTGGKKVQLTSKDRIWANNGQGSARNDGSVRFVPGIQSRGPAAITFEVTDGRTSTDRSGRKAVLTIPVTVLPPPLVTEDPTKDEQTNQPPVAQPVTLTIGAGEEAKSVDVARAVTDPEGGQLSFTELTGSLPTGIELSQAGMRVKAQADPSVASGTTGELTGEVTDPDGGTAKITLTVKVEASSKAPPRAVDDTVDDAVQGSPVSVPVLTNDVNPFKPEPLKIISAVPETGGGAAAIDGTFVKVTPEANFVGKMVVRYQIEDTTGSPDRRSEARIRLTVTGKPSRPGVARAGEVGDGKVVLTWTAAKDNGKPISTYRVQGSGAEGKKVSQECKSTTCTITGLTNDVGYKFTVVAVNEIGESEPSAPSAEIRPDVKPGTPGAPSTEFGDAEISLEWTASKTTGSAVQNYTIELIGPAGTATREVPGGSTSYTWTGLTNGSAYRFRVQARNKAPEPSEFSERSKSEVPAARPSPPQDVRATDDGGELGREITVSWKAPSNNGGDDVTSYSVYANGEKLDDSVSSDKTKISATLTNGKTYNFTVTATNKAGESAESKTSNAVKPFGAPDPPPEIELSDGPGRVGVDLTPAQSQGESVEHTLILSNGTRKVIDTSTESVPLPAGSSVTATVSACSESKCVSSKTSEEATSYGAPGKPGVGKDEGAVKSVDFSWSSPASINNGASIAKVQISFDGQNWEDKSPNGSVSKGDNYGQKFTMRARAVNNKGQTGEVAQVAGSTDDPPVKRVAVRRGAKKNSTDGALACTGNTCREIVINVSGFVNVNSITCTLTDETGLEWKPPYKFGVNADGAGGQAGPLLYGRQDKWITATCNGVTSPKDKWKDLATT